MREEHSERADFASARAQSSGCPRHQLAGSTELPWDYEVSDPGSHSQNWLFLSYRDSSRYFSTHSHAISATRSPSEGRTTESYREHLREIYVSQTVMNTFYSDQENLVLNASKNEGVIGGNRRYVTDFSGREHEIAVSR